MVFVTNSLQDVIVFQCKTKWFNVFHSVKNWSAFVSYYASKQENQKKKDLM